MTKKQKRRIESEIQSEVVPSQRGGYVYSDVMQNKNLSANLRLLVAVAATYPQQSWTFRVSHLCDVLGWGRAKYFQTIREAKEAGLLRTVQGRYEWVPNPYLASAENQHPVLKNSTANSVENQQCRKSAPLSITKNLNITKEKPLLDSDESSGVLFEIEPDTAVEITGKEKENSAKEREAEAKALRHELAKKHIGRLHAEFVAEIGLDPAVMKPTAAAWKTAHSRFAECAMQLRSEANGHFKNITTEEWVDRAAELFESGMWAYLKNDRIVSKRWLHFASADVFRSLIAPQKASRL